MLRVLVALVGLFVVAHAGAQDILCSNGKPARADFGIRYRFTAGDFIQSEGEPTWIHFLTEPLVTEVAADGPARNRLKAGDVIVAVDGQLITTREGSRRFFRVRDQLAELRIRRDGRAVAVRVNPRSVCPESPGQTPRK